MALPAEQLVIDARSRFLEMKSLQPYSTTDEYLYAMKEDLAEWLSNMYEDWRPITADNFLECLGKTKENFSKKKRNSFSFLF